MKRTGISKLALVVVTILVTAFLVLGGGLTYLKKTNRVIVDKSLVDRLVEEEGQNDKTKYLSDLIEDHFYYDYDKKKVETATCDAMLNSLGDPYSKYFGPEEKDPLMESLDGSFTGIGIAFKKIKGDFLITEVMGGGPADSAGIKKGDQIISVDGKTFDNEEDLTQAIRGEAGESVEVTYKRGDKTFTEKIVRGNIEESTVEKKLIDGSIGYIKITSFGSSTYKNFEKALSVFEKSKVKGIILDLRGNPGGLFDEGIKVADRILGECRITYTEDADGKREDYNSDNQATDLAMLVLVDQTTASTGEMVAAALQGNKKALLVGEKTFGKGVMQEVYDFDDGSAVHLTVGEFFTPGGERINEKGLTPDIGVKKSASPGEDIVLKKAIDKLKE